MLRNLGPIKKALKFVTAEKDNASTFLFHDNLNANTLSSTNHFFHIASRFRMQK